MFHKVLILFSCLILSGCSMRPEFKPLVKGLQIEFTSILKLFFFSISLTPRPEWGGQNGPPLDITPYISETTYAG